MITPRKPTPPEVYDDGSDGYSVIVGLHRLWLSEDDAQMLVDGIARVRQRRARIANRIAAGDTAAEAEREA